MMAQRPPTLKTRALRKEIQGTTVSQRTMPMTWAIGQAAVITTGAAKRATTMAAMGGGTMPRPIRSRKSRRSRLLAYVVSGTTESNGTGANDHARAEAAKIDIAAIDAVLKYMSALPGGSGGAVTF